MRRTATFDGLSLKVYAGTTGILLAFNASPERRAGLLGFAVHRSAPDGSGRWLAGQLVFEGQPHLPGEFPPTNEAPIQAFRWGDYAVYPNRTYTYTLHAVYGAPTQLDVQPGPSVTVTTQPQDAGEHIVTFNRAAAASQAFARRFPKVDEELTARRRAGRLAVLPPDALEWLSRGALEQLLRFIDAALDDTWALDIAIYEYELLPVLHAVERALLRRVDVRVIYHAGSRPGDKQTQENEHHLARVPETYKRARKTSAIHHHKFMVRSRVEGGVRVPHAVLCGSTNFTENGVYRQANVVHVAQTPHLAARYLELFEVLFAGTAVRETRSWIEEHNPLPEAWGEAFVGFSPRSRRADLRAFVTLIQGAQRDVLFCTAFELEDSVQSALWGEREDSVLRLGIQNRLPRPAAPPPSLVPLSPGLADAAARDPTALDEVMVGTHRDRTRQYVAPALLPDGLEGYLRETLAGQAGNILVHTKLIILDFTTDTPTIISGSHNYSANASQSNDENYLVLRGNTEIADAYGCELLRIYDHYRFRYALRQTPSLPAPTLASSDAWTTDYYGGDALRTLDRERFGAPVGDHL